MPLFDLRKPADRDALQSVSVADIIPNPNQPRVTFDDDAIDELARSISEVGLIQPLIVRRAGERFELVAGERRLRAVKKLGLEAVNCIVRASVEDEQSATMALIENLQREDLHFLEEARCYESLINAYGFTQEGLAKRLGKSQSSIANKLRILKLSAPVLETVKENGLTERHARAVLKLPDEESQLVILKRAAQNGLSVKATEDAVEKSLDRMYDERRDGAKPRPKILRIVKDYRLFMNSINAAVEQLREAGFQVEIEQSDREDGVNIAISVTRR